MLMTSDDDDDDEDDDDAEEEEEGGDNDPPPIPPTSATSVADPAVISFISFIAYPSFTTQYEPAFPGPAWTVNTAPFSAVSRTAPSSRNECTVTSPSTSSTERGVINTLWGYGKVRRRSDGNMTVSGERTIHGPGEALIPQNVRSAAAGAVAPIRRSISAKT